MNIITINLDKSETDYIFDNINSLALKKNKEHFETEKILNQNYLSWKEYKDLCELNNKMLEYIFKILVSNSENKISFERGDNTDYAFKSLVVRIFEVFLMYFSDNNICEEKAILSQEDMNNYLYHKKYIKSISKKLDYDMFDDFGDMKENYKNFYM